MFKGRHPTMARKRGAPSSQLSKTAPIILAIFLSLYIFYRLPSMDQSVEPRPAVGTTGACAFMRA